MTKTPTPNDPAPDDANTKECIRLLAAAAAASTTAAIAISRRIDLARSMPYGPGDRNRTQALVADLGHAHALAEHAQRIEHYIRTFRSDA